jgi:ADP-ribose pyrophosphatase
MDPMGKKVHKVKKLFSNPWINMFEGRAFFSNKEVCWTFASRKENPLKNKSPDAVMIVPIISDLGGEPKLLLTKEFRIPVNGYEYGFPAGLLEEGQSLVENANRELLEETGFEITKVLKESPSRLYSTAGLSDEMVAILIVTARKVAEPSLEETEEITTLTLSHKDLMEFLKTNPIMGAKAWPICYAFELAKEFPS